MNDKKKLLVNGLYDVVVDNSIAKSHNINIDYPTYLTSASSEEEAIKKMKESDFPYRNKEVSKVYTLSEPLFV